MKKKKQETAPRKLNIGTPPAEDQQNWTLEEIMDEFGGWTSQKPEKTPEPRPEPEKPVQEPEPKLSEQKPESDTVRIADIVRTAEPLKNEEAKPDLMSDTIRFTPVQPEKKPEETQKVWSYHGEPDPVGDDAERKRIARQEQQRNRQQLRRENRKKKKEQRRQETPDHTFSSAEEAYQFYSEKTTLQLRLALSVLLSLCSAVLLTLLSGVIPGVEMSDRKRLFGILMLGLLILQALLAYDLCMEGVTQILRLRPDGCSMLLIQLAAVTVDAFFAIAENRIPFCTAVSLQLTVALWGRRLLIQARRRSLKAVCSMEQPVAAVREEKAWHGYDCIFRGPADTGVFASQLEQPDAGRRILRVYAPVITILTLILSVFAAMRSSENFVWAWAAMLTAATPVGCFIAFARPFSAEARQLLRSGCAVAGWTGAGTLGGEAGLVVEDQDLFPPGNVTLNGMKVYSAHSVSQIVGYADAVVQTAGSGLTPLFEEMMRSQNGRHYHVDAFRRYEGGGLGAEIGGDVVLMGSFGFMKLMKVQMPEGTKLKQAVYLSINAELAAVFALTYAPASNVKSSLFAAARSNGLVPILATRDFMITPQFLKQRYKLAPERIEFPTVEERARLSAREARPQSLQGAMMARGGFGSFVSAVTGARSLRSASIAALAVSFTGSILGLLILFFLTFIGAVNAVSAWNLMIFTLLWLLPNVLISFFAGNT